MLNADGRKQIDRLRQRVATALFVTGSADALAAAALIAGTTLVVLRVCAVGMTWSPWWLATAALPLAWGGWRARRQAITADACGVIMDRGLGLGGLMMSSLEADTTAWQGTLSSRLALAPPIRPRVNTRRLTLRVGAALAFLGIVLLLPAAVPSAIVTNPALVAAVTAAKERLDVLVEKSALDPKAANDDAARLSELAERLKDDKHVSWNDLDAAAAKIEHDAELHAEETRKMREALAEAADAASASDDPVAAAAAAEDLEKLLAKAEAAGMFKRLPADVAAQLDAMRAGGAVAASKLAANPAAAKALARAAAKALAAKLSTLIEAGTGDQRATDDDADPKPGASSKPAHKHTAACAGGH